MSALVHPAITALGVTWLERRAPSAIPPEVRGTDLGRLGGVPIAAQRSVLEAVESAGGAEALLGLASALRESSSELPLVYVLLNSSSVADLIDKELRLNRFLHSHHRVRVHASGSSHLELEHYSRSGRAPVRVESLFVLGAHLALLTEVGCRGLRARLPESADPQRWILAEDRRRPVPEGDCRRWIFHWSSFEPTRRVLRGLDELLLETMKPRDLTSKQTLSEQLEQVLQQDLARRWTLAEVARLCSRSTRSLQRALAEEGTSFTALLDQVRVEEAARLLAEPGRSVTEIGYACGFADAAHFSRRFRRSKGSAPSSWRRSSPDPEDR